MALDGVMPAAPLPPAPPEGLIVELVTPLTADGGLDEEGLSRLVAKVTPDAAGILAGSPRVGEALGLPFATRTELLTHLLSGVAGRIPLFFGITGNSWEETQELAVMVQEQCRLQDYPGQVYLADLPLWYHSNRGLPQTYQRLFKEVSLPLVVLNLPEVLRGRGPLLKHRNIRTHVFKKLALLPALVGLIYQGDIRRFLNYHYAAAARPGFAFYEADESNFLTRPGAWGVLSAGAQLFPGAWRRAVRACLHPEEAASEPASLELWNVSQHLLELAGLCQSRPAALLKTALAFRGVLNSPTTAPDTPSASPSQKEALLAALASVPHQF